MDNQFNQPGGTQPTGQQPAGYPQAGYGTGVPPQQWGNPADPYGVQQPQAAPGGSLYETLQQPAAPYGAPQQPYAAPGGSLYDTLQQPAAPYGTAQQPQATPGGYYAQQPAAPYGTVQQPYADPGAYQPPYSDNGYQHLFGQGTQEMPQQPAAPQQPAQAPRGKAFAGAEAPLVPGARRRMSVSDIALIVVAMLAVIGFAGWYLYATYAPEAARYGQIASGSLSAIHSGSSLIVRNEIPYDAESVTSVVYDAKEGSKVARNTLICHVYSTGYSASAVRQLQEYRDEIRDYQEKLIETSTIYDGKSERYNADVMTLAKEIRSLVAGDDGSLPNIEAQLTQTVKERQDYFDKKYASDQRFSRMKDDERSQTQRIDSWTLAYSATTDALVSFYSDGFEYAINGSNYATFEPDEVRAMISGRKPEGAEPPKGKTTIYRMVKDNAWYALFLSDDTEWNPVVGETYELQLERFGDTPVSATVVSFTKAGGELLVRLCITGSVEQVMYLRTCDAVLAESMSTLMINERGIYEQDGMTGVVVVEGSTESFIPVNVLHRVDGYAYFQTVNQGLLFEGMTVRLFA